MSDENGQEMPQESEEKAREENPGQLPATVPNGKLTIRETRLAGSANCLNCGTGLQGPFCHYCGQPDKNLMRFFPALIREMLEDFMDFDSRFMRTIKPLVFKPGRLTRDYLDGRRFRYVPPMRLYIFSSLALFFLFAVFAGSSLNFKSTVGSDSPGIQIHLDEGDEEEIRESTKDLNDIHPGLGDQVAEHIVNAAEESESEADEIPNEVNFEFNGKPWDPETNPVTIPLMPEFVTRWLNREIEESPQKGKAIEENPNLMVEQVLDVLPGTMFILLPLVALLFKFWYLFAKKYYVEHLIFALHNHAFIFVMLIVMFLMSVLTGLLEPDEPGTVTQASEVIKTVILIWIPIYLLISLKRVYRQGWALTLAKYSAIGFSYMVLLGFTVVLVALLSFVLL